MSKLLVDFLMRVFATFLFTVAVLWFYMTNSNFEQQLLVAREVAVNDSVYAQSVGAEKYEETKAAAAITGEILSKPDYMIEVQIGAISTTYKWFGDGSVIVCEENSNASPGTDGKKVKRLHSSAELGDLYLSGEFRMSVTYDDSASITKVVYRRV